MSYETVAVSDRAFGWDDEIKNDGPDFVLLPEGDYLFTVTGFELRPLRGRYQAAALLDGQADHPHPRRRQGRDQRDPPPVSALPLRGAALRLL